MQHQVDTKISIGHLNNYLQLLKNINKYLMKSNITNNNNNSKITITSYQLNQQEH